MPTYICIYNYYYLPVPTIEDNFRNEPQVTGSSVNSALMNVFDKGEQNGDNGGNIITKRQIPKDIQQKEGEIDILSQVQNGMNLCKVAISQVKEKPTPHKSDIKFKVKKMT